MSTPSRPLLATAVVLFVSTPLLAAGQSPVDGMPASAAGPLQSEAMRAARRVATPEAARAAGYHRIAPPAVRHNLNALVGEHWINQRYLRAQPIDPSRPAFLMFYPLGGQERLIGLAYGVVQDTSAALPERLAGYPGHWHVHHPCGGVRGLGPILADDTQDCRRLGGVPGRTRLAMMHVWLNIANPLGPYASENPALPFVATGLEPPTSDDFKPPDRARRVLTLALALGESFGATPRLGSLVDFDSRFAQRVAPRRAAIRGLLRALRSADAARDSARYGEIADSAIAVWHGIRAAYLDAARSDMHRVLLQRWYARVTELHLAGRHDPH